MCTIQILAALLTPVVGLVAAAVLVAQYFLQKQRWRLDLFDKRYPVYDFTMQYLSSIAQNANLTSKELTEFDRNCKDKEFLFGKDIQQFLEQLYTKGGDLIAFDAAIREAQSREQESKRYQEKQELVSWFGDQFKTSNALFGRYLRIAKK